MSKKAASRSEGVANDVSAGNIVYGHVTGKPEGVLDESNVEMYVSGVSFGPQPHEQARPIRQQCGS